MTIKYITVNGVRIKATLKNATPLIAKSNQKGFVAKATDLGYVTSTDVSMNVSIGGALAVDIPGNDGNLFKYVEDYLHLTEVFTIPKLGSTRDNVGLVEIKSFSFGKKIFDLPRITETLTKGIGRPVLDSRHLTDFVSKGPAKLFIEYRYLTETNTKAFSKTLSDVLTISESFNLDVQGIDFVLDASTMSDSQTRAFGKSLVDTKSIQDQTSKGLSKELLDTLSLTEDVLSATGEIQSPEDIGMLSEVVVSGVGKAIVDTKAVTETVSGFLSGYVAAGYFESDYVGLHLNL
jgi:hypothetical protein